ncbi:hypothetical protein C8J56DRAFT_740203, partial [Mycena floridula]
YKQWYRSPLLSDTAEGHTIRLTVTAGIESLYADYMAISPGQHTPLLGRTLMIDDTYSGLTFGSGWIPLNNNAFDLGGNPAYTFQNTTLTTSTPGSKFSFSYTGTNMTLYGVFNWKQLGSYDLVVMVDNQAPVTKNFNTRSIYDNSKGYIQQTNFVLFATPDSMQAGNHTIVFTLSRCDKQILIIDYILYTPSFSSLATMPDLT